MTEEQKQDCINRANSFRDALSGGSWSDLQDIQPMNINDDYLAEFFHREDCIHLMVFGPEKNADAVFEYKARFIK